jgi:hypothetical protein
LGTNEVFEVATPNLAYSIRRPGDYRIEVDPAAARARPVCGKAGRTRNATRQAARCRSAGGAEAHQADTGTAC